MKVCAGILNGVEELMPQHMISNKPRPDFDVPDDLWAEYHEAIFRYLELHETVIMCSKPLTRKARKDQKLTANGIRQLDGAAAGQHLSPKRRKQLLRALKAAP